MVIMVIVAIKVVLVEALVAIVLANVVMVLAVLMARKIGLPKSGPHLCHGMWKQAGQLCTGSAHTRGGTVTLDTTTSCEILHVCDDGRTLQVSRQPNH